MCPETIETLSVENLIFHEKQKSGSETHCKEYTWNVVADGYLGSLRL